MLTYVDLKQILPKENNRPNVENSPHLVTLHLAAGLIQIAESKQMNFNSCVELIEKMCCWATILKNSFFWTKNMPK
jgi:hypothetical protein